MGRSRYYHAQVSPHPKCPDPYCNKTWAPTRKVAQELYRENVARTGHTQPVRFYEHRGGYHWTSDVEGKTIPLGSR